MERTVACWWRVRHVLSFSVLHRSAIWLVFLLSCACMRPASPCPSSMPRCAVPPYLYDILFFLPRTSGSAGEPGCSWVLVVPFLRLIVPLSRMPGVSDRKAAYVSCRIHCLPACFSRAAIAVSKLTLPAPEIPPLVSLCTCGLPGYSAREGEVFSAAAGDLHPRHQLPFVLSRVAASKAIASLSPSKTLTSPKTNEEPAVVFTHRREAAPILHGCCLSIAHEDSVAASVAWPVSSPDSFSPNDPNASPKRLCRGTKVVCSHCSLSDATATAFAYAIDVVSVAEIHRVRSRFPRLGQRWMPQCITAASAEDVRRGLVCVQKQPPESGAEVGAPEAGHGSEDASACQAAGRRDGWWEHLPTPCESEADAYAAVVLAQHWGARECAVKLVGIPGRSFAYECVGALLPRGGGAVGAESNPFTVSFMVSHSLYLAGVSGVEAATLAKQGLQPLLYLYTWTEWVPFNRTVNLPYVVMLACTPCSSAAR